MFSSRRAQTTPLDFEYALRREGLTASLLKPHLKPPVPESKTQLRFDLPEPEELPYQPPAALLGVELSGAPEKDTKKYIPKKFPTFPSTHTFKSTEVKPAREADPRKIREQATEAARHGEEALRRLVKVGKAADHKGARRVSEKSEKHKQRHDLWEKTMNELVLGKMNTLSSKLDGGDAEQKSVIINAGKEYGRKPVARVKKLGTGR
jgi:transcription initiation factor TFIID subunit 8